MKISKENIKIILGMALCIILMFAIVWNLGTFLKFLGLVLTVLTPVIIGFCIAFILNIIMSFIEPKLFGFMLKPDKKGRTYKKIARLLSIIITLVVFVGAIALLMFFIIPQVIQTITAIVAGIPAFAERAIVFCQKYLDNFGITSDQITELVLDGRDFLTTVGNFLKNNMNSFIMSATSIGTSLVSGLTSTFLGIFVAIYFMFDKEQIISQISRLFRALLKPQIYKKSAHIIEVSSKSFSNFISGQCIEAVILGVLCFIGMIIFRIPYAPVISVLIGVCALIPILGAWIGTAISFLLILIADPVKAVWFVVYILVLQQVEGNLIYPRVVGKQVGLPGVWVILTIVVGTGVMGPFGALLAVPVASVAYALVLEYVLAFEKKEKIKND